HALLEFIHAARCIHELLLACVKRMAHVANTDDDDRPGGAGPDHVAARATYLGIRVLWMNLCFHKRPANIPACRLMTSPNLDFFGLPKSLAIGPRLPPNRYGGPALPGAFKPYSRPRNFTTACVRDWTCSFS